MQSTIMLTLAGLRKNKKQMVSQVVIIFFAALLLNIGLLTAIRFGGYFDERATALNAAHIAFAYGNSNYDDKFLHFFRQHEHTVAIQQDNILLLQAKLKMPAATFNAPMPIIGFNYDDTRLMSRINLVGEHLPTDENSIYVPYVFKFTGGVQLGGPFTLTVNEEHYDNTKEKDYDFIVAGFTEDILLGVTNVGGVGVYLPQASYKKFSGELAEFYKGTFISAQLTDAALSSDMLDEYTDYFTGEDGASWGIALPLAKFVRTIMSDIVSALIVGFSMIIMVVSLIVIRFRIINTIEEEMRNYGALKAIGYTNRQIIAAIIMQFSIITLAGAFVGIAVSFAVINAIALMLATQTGLNWIQGFDPVISTVSLSVMVLATVLTATASAVKLRKTPPIAALRGDSSGVLRINILPIDLTALPLGFMLAIKTTFLNIKQNLLILLILSAISFTVVFGIVMGYNAPTDTFIKMMAGQYADIYAQISPKEDADEIIADIRKQDGVTKVAICDWASVIFDNQYLNVMVYQDFADILNDQTYAGRNPQHPHEVVIGGMLGTEKGKVIGDTIRLSLGEREEEYIISGFFQSSNNLGRESLLTAEGYRMLDPDYKERAVFIDIRKDIDPDVFIEGLEQRYGEKLYSYQNFREFIGIQVSSILAMINAIIVAFNVITVLVVVFILYLVVKTLVLRRKKELGIQKAVGFTTFQLMNQIAGSFVPVALLGAGIGSIVGSLSMNYFLGLLFRSVGIMKVDFVIPIMMITAASLLICLLIYTVSMLVSVRIKKISAYALITE